MLTRIRSRLSYSNVVATLALFVALGGSAIAVNKIRSKNIARNAVKSRHIAQNAVKGSDVAENAVGASEIAAGAVGAGELAAAVRARRLDYFATEAADGSPTELVDLGELSVTARCEEGSTMDADRTAVELELRPTVAATAHTGGVQALTGLDEATLASNLALPANTTTNVLTGTADSDDNNYNADLIITYRSASKTITLLLHARANDLFGTGSGGCSVQGTAVPAT